MSNDHDDNEFDGDGLDETVVDEYADEADDTSDEAAGDTSASSRVPAAAGSTAAVPRKPKKQRTSPRQFLREVRSELRKVAWPARKELISYSVVVLVSVSIITLFITGLDYVFGQLILRMFSS